MQESAKDAIAILCMMKEVAQLDKEIDEQERGLLEHMAGRLAVPNEVLEAIIRGDIKSEIMAPSDEWERIPYFQMCVMMSGVNGDFREKEAGFCKRLGHRLGLREVVLEEILRLFKVHFPKPVPIEALKKAYQIGHN